MLLPPDAEHRRRLLRAVVLAAEADGQEVDEQLMQLYSDCLLGQPQHGRGGADGSNSSIPDSLAQALLPPPPQPGWCYKMWSYAPAGEAAAASLAAAGELELSVAQQRQACLAAHRGQQQQQQAGALPCCAPASAGSGVRGLLALHVSLNLLEGGTGCHEWEAGFFLAEWVLNNAQLVAGRTCLEVGCGAGMVGIALHRAGAAHVMCTDGDPQTVDNCRFNLQLNDVPLADGERSGQRASCADGGSGGSSGSIRQPPRQPAAECRRLCWEDGWPAGGAGTSEGQQPAPTVVLGADLLYDPTVIPTLLVLLKQVLVAAAGSAAAGDACGQEPEAQLRDLQQPAAYLATTLRNEATLRQFLAEVQADAAVCMRQLAGPSVPGAAVDVQLTNHRLTPVSEAHAAAAASTASTSNGRGSGRGVRWQHVPELDAARERIFLHRITLAA